MPTSYNGRIPPESINKVQCQHYIDKKSQNKTVKNDIVK